MGVVLAARESILNREVAIKLPLVGWPARDLVEGRFREESRITAQLPHPGIPPVCTLGTLPDGRPFLAMKLVHGQTLASMLAEEPAGGGKWLQWARIAEEMCRTVGVRPLAGDRPPGPQARQRHGWPVRRGPSDGLGAGQECGWAGCRKARLGRRPGGPDGRRGGSRHAGVHGSGAVPRRTCGRPSRCVRIGGDPVSRPDRLRPPTAGERPRKCWPGRRSAMSRTPTPDCEPARWSRLSSHSC